MSTAEAKKPKTEVFLSAVLWEKTHGEAYETWRKDRWTTSCKATQDFLNHVLPLGRVTGEKRLLPHQAEALQRAIYSFEHLKMNPVMATLATGTGKTVVMASVIAWLACQEEAVNTFLLFCPNTIVRDRLRRDFETLSVFQEFNFFPTAHIRRLKGLSCSVVDEFKNCTNLLGHNVIVANRHQFQRGYSGGNDHLAFMQKEGGRLAVFNDEAHNTRGAEYSRTLAILKPQTDFRFDVTATPDRADNLRPQSHEIYNLSVVEAITGTYKHNRFIDRSFENYPTLIKDVVVQRPSIKTLGAITFDELIFRDPKSNKAYTVREIDWDEWPRKKNLQLVLDPGGMKMQLQLAVEALEKKRLVAKDRYKPLLFVIAPSIIGAQQAVEMMKKDFKLNPLLVVDDETEYEKRELRDAAASLGGKDSPYDSVVSVYMLREGWDVPEVSIICLLRGFGSPLFAHQVLGRGLRLIRKPGLEGDRSVQELTVIDHPCLQLDDLWAEIDALVKAGEEITRPREISRDGEAEAGEKDEKAKLPEQTVVREDLYHLLLPVPSPLPVESITTERALELLETALQQIKDYKPESNVIVEVEIDKLDRMRPKRTVETSDKPLRVSAIPTSTQDRELAQRQFNKLLMDWTEDYSKRYQPFVTQENAVYKTILAAFERTVFQDQPTTEVPAQTLFAAQHFIPQLREAVTFDLNHRIYAEELLQNE